ncbi:hypothetical protein PTI98_004144 [Pleurotus ostreatus]|nr:hypothetical protein PTI98_004144 [Pleurotus ostreatus]
MTRFDFLATNSFDIIGATPKSIASELLILTQQNAYCQENICDVILFLVKASPKAFILLDGLDEGLSDSGWERTGVKDVLDFVIRLAISRAGFNFLWASLMIEDLQKRTTSTAAMQEMFYQDQLPTSLGGYYRAILNRIQTHHRSIACRIFSMVMFAKRPLRVEELSEAVGIL